MKKIYYPIQDAAARCGISETVILEFVTHEWIVPAQPDQVMLDDEDIARARFILELQNQMGVNHEGIAIILHLIDQLYGVYLPDDK
jgi:chaperone modulatory protein CbpM